MQGFTLQDALKKHLEGDMGTAERMYRAILERHPNKFEPCFYMASLLTQQNKIGEAIVFLYRCSMLSDNPVVWNNLGSLFRRLNHTELAKEVLLKGMENPGELEADLCNNLGTTYVNEGAPSSGETFLRRAIRIEPEHVQAHWNLGLVLLENRRWEEGWKNYHYGTHSDERIGRWLTWPQWHGEKTSVCVYGEQGLGDEIMFSSMIPDVTEAAEEVVFECHPRLEQTFKRSFPGIHI